jgi:two-component system, OmpR family, sensor histidine kinase KdpD
MPSDSPAHSAPHGDRTPHPGEAAAPGRSGDDVAATGRFRVYLGMASGVGKTYAMLDEAARRAARGRDVVVGIVETHGRPATAARLSGLEVVPPKTVTYRGARFTEMDLDAILARKPDLVLIDEIAHTNVPGSGRHEKRWQDVLELLDTDISVISTLNTQHIESLADVVEAITGARVRERIPDAVLARADQIELVDSSPEQLRRRVLHGNVYPEEGIDQALDGFFRADNLRALRELTLRFLARETDDGMLTRIRRTAQGHSRKGTERLLVGVTDATGTETVLRRAGLMAAPLGADLYVAHVHPSEVLHRTRRSAALQSIRQLADDLGGTWMEIEDDDPARALIRAAIEHDATQIVLGPSRRGRWQRLLTRGSTVHRLTRSAGLAGIDVHIIARPPTSAAVLAAYADNAWSEKENRSDAPT